MFVLFAILNYFFPDPSDDFSAGVRDQEWDRVKVVLNQPFRKDQQFGLSLLRIITTEEARASTGVSMRAYCKICIINECLHMQTRKLVCPRVNNDHKIDAGD